MLTQGTARKYKMVLFPNNEWYNTSPGHQCHKCYILGYAIFSSTGTKRSQMSACISVCPSCLLFATKMSRSLFLHISDSLELKD